MGDVNFLTRRARVIGAHPVSSGLRQSIAVLVSVATHLILVFGLGVGGGSSGSLMQAEPPPRAPISIRLVSPRPEADTHAPIRLDPARPESVPAPTNPAAPIQPAAERTLKPLAFAPPTPPHYFRPRELSRQTSGSLDIPPELAEALAGDVPRSASLRLQINELGDVDNVFVDASNFSPTEQQQLIDIFKDKKFDAGKIAGEAVKTEIEVEILVRK